MTTMPLVQTAATLKLELQGTTTAVLLQSTPMLRRCRVICLPSMSLECKRTAEMM